MLEATEPSLQNSPATEECTIIYILPTWLSPKTYRSILATKQKFQEQSLDQEIIATMKYFK